VSDVFISYSRKNSDFAHKLDSTLTAAKRDVWIDWQDIARGEDWWRSIQTGIDSADTTLIIITENWLVSEVCQRELEYIRKQNKRVFPIIRERIEGDLAIRVKGTWVDQEWEQRARDNWKYLRSVNWLYFDDDTTFDTAFKDLLTALDTDQAYVKSHTRYLVRALEWQQSKRDPSFLLEGDQLASAQTWLKSSISKTPEPLPTHHEYVTASDIAEKVRIARDKTREQLIRRFRQAAIGLGLGVIAAIIAAVFVGQQYISARAEVTRAGATLQQVNIQVTDAINQQVTAAAKVQAAEYQVATATIEQGNAIVAQQTSAAREHNASTEVAVAGATLSPVPPTLTAVALIIKGAFTQQDIALQIANASLRMNDKQIAAALQIADSMVADYPKESLAYIGRGIILDNNGEFDAAIADYTTALQLDPTNATPYINRGLVYDKLGKLDESIADFSEAIKIDPQDTEVYNNRGLEYYQQGKLDTAVADFNQAIQLDSTNTFAYNNRGLVYTDQDKLDAALADFTQAISLDPQYIQAYSGRGQVYLQQGKDDAAVADYTQAIQLDPTVSNNYYYRGLVYANQNKNDAAITDLTQAIQLNPQNETAYFIRGRVYLFQGNNDAALADFTEAVQLNPDDVDAFYNRGKVYHALGKDDLAIADNQHAIELNPQYLLAYSDLAYYYATQGKFTEALAAYWKWVQLNQTNSTTADIVSQDKMPFPTTVQMTQGLTYNIPFEGKVGQILQAQAVAADNATVDPLLVLLDPQGKPLFFNDDTASDNTNSSITDYALPADGTYTLVVTYAGGGSEGDIQVTLDLKPAASITPSPTPTAS
jgi:tetratricopeptide (TPR) repeat protein